MPAIVPQRRERGECNYAPIGESEFSPQPREYFFGHQIKRPGPIHIGPGLPAAAGVRLSDCSVTALRPFARTQGNSDETCQNPKAYSRSAEAGQVLSKPIADPVRGQ
jgi:hypothetical protein